MNLELKDTDFGTAERVVDAINRNLGPGTAAAMDGRVVQVRAPRRRRHAWASFARIENLDVTRGQGRRQGHPERPYRFHRDEPAR